jgi:hypothetical protein
MNDICPECGKPAVDVDGTMQARRAQREFLEAMHERDEARRERDEAQQLASRFAVKLIGHGYGPIHLPWEKVPQNDETAQP